MLCVKEPTTTTLIEVNNSYNYKLVPDSAINNRNRLFLVTKWKCRGY